MRSTKAGRDLGLAMSLAPLVFCAACHSDKLSTVTASLIFSSPDQPAELTHPDAGVYQIAFGEVSVGSIKTLTLDLVTLGSTVTLAAVTALQPDAEFGLPLVPDTLVQAAPTQITVSFAPSSPGDKSAQYRLTYDVPGTEAALFDLSGVGVAHGLSVAPNPVDFGEVEFTQSQTLALTISNTSQLTESLVFSPLQGQAAALFSLGTPSSTSLAPGASATLNVSFAPTELDGASASFTASAGPGILPVTVDLGGTGVASLIQVSPPLSFGFVQVGDVLVKSAVVRNEASYATLHVLALPSVAQPSAIAFSVGSPEPVPPLAIPPGQSVEIPVAFAPPSLDAFAGSLLLTTDDPLSPYPAVQLQGYGGGPHISCQPELSFGPVPVGALASEDLVCINAGATIPSHGDLVLQIAQKDLSTDNSAFVPNLVLVLPDGGLAGPGYSASLSAGQLAKIRVRFQPADAGLFQGRLTVPSNDVDDLDAGTLLVAQGVTPGPCTLSLAPQELSFGEVPHGGFGILQFELSNVGQNLCFVTQVSLDADSNPAFWLLTDQLATRVLSFPGDTNNPAGLPSSVMVEAEYEPTSAEVAAAGKVDIVTLNSAPPGQSIALTGTSQSACLSSQPSYLDLGARGLSPSTQRICTPDGASFTAVNGCTTPVTLNRIAINSGLDAVPQFTLQDSLQLPLTIPPGGQASFEASFTPTSAGAKVEGITLVSSDLPNDPLLVTLLGDAVPAGTRTDTFTVPPLTNQLDVLWVLDDEDDQLQVENIEGLFPQLINTLSQERLDYQMAVTSTDTCDAGNSDQGAFEPCNHCLSNAGASPEFITSATVNLNASLTYLFAAFAALPPLSSCASLNGDKHFFDSIAEAFSPALLSGHNAGFIRNGAYLAVIVVNGDAEDDGAGLPMQGPYLTSLAQVVADVQRVKADPRMVSVSYINSGAGSSNTDQRIGQLVADTGGVEIDTTAPAAVWQASLLDLFPVTEGNAFPLSFTRGSISQIEVEVDGVATSAWTFDESTNDILFTAGNLPVEGATVTVSYVVGCP